MIIFFSELFYLEARESAADTGDLKIHEYTGDLVVKNTHLV